MTEVALNGKDTFHKDHLEIAMNNTSDPPPTNGSSLKKSPTSSSVSDMETIPEHDTDDDAVQPPRDYPSSSAIPTSPPPTSPSPGSPEPRRRRSIIKEPGTKPTMRKKTVSFSKLPNESGVKDAADCVIRMQEGHQFVKMRSNSRVYNRVYWLEVESNCLRWEPSKKDAGKARIEVGQIREVRPGKTSELFLTSDISTHFPDECSFSIIHGDGKSLDLIANSADDANVWITGLRCLLSGQDMEGLRMRSDARNAWLSSVFDGADLNGDGFLDEEESFTLLWSLSDGIRELKIKQRLQEYLQTKADDKTRLSREEFIKIFKDVATRPEVYFLLARYSTSEDRMSIDDLMNFLESEQGMLNVSKEDCLKLIDRFEPSDVLRSIPALGIDGFTKYLISDHCDIFDPKHKEVCQNMNQPLSHYFIASSHNTYLMEDQVSGPSDVSAYARALLRCCRCVELDCWDGSDGEPVITHGHTRTNAISFREVIKAINDNAFKSSVYPVVLTIENHCNKEQQLLMASCLRETLGDKIYLDPLPKTESSLPSPGLLKNRFLIRARKLPPDCSDDVDYVSDEDEGKEVIDQMQSTHFDETPQSPHITDHAERQQPLVRELSDLVSICATVTFVEDFSLHDSSYSCVHTCSVHEKTASRLAQSSPEEFVTHNRKFLTRIFPGGGRLDSSNFNPQDYWNCGVQIASLNYQTPGLMMDINDGKFSMNGGCGYVLKPAIMTDPLAYYNFHAHDILPGVQPKTLHLRVISGQNFPKPRGGGAKGHVIDPYVLIEIFGVPSDCSEQRTRTSANNSGASAIFDEPFEFRLSLPALSLVRFVVLDDDYIGDEFIGQFTIPFECLLPGYRHLKLRSIFDEPLEDASLFVHVAISDADAASGFVGNMTPIQTLNSNNKQSSKRVSVQKRSRKPRSRKDSDVLQVFHVNQPTADDVFRAVVEPLQLASALRDSQRFSLSCFREACGVAPLASIKQCIRALSQRSRSESMFGDVAFLARQKRKLSSPVESVDTENDLKLDVHRRAASTNGEKVRLSRQISDTSQSSNESSAAALGHVKIWRNDRRISLQLKGQMALSESWRKVSSALDTLIDDSFALLDRARNCSNLLTSTYEKAAEIYQGLPKLMTNGNAIDTGDHTIVPSASLNKKSKSKKKQSLELGRQKQSADDEAFRWNCSVIKGQRDQLMTSRAEVERMLSELWDAAVQYGFAELNSSAADKREVNGFEEAHSANENTNNNTSIAKLQCHNTSKLPNVSFMRSMSQLTKPRSKSSTRVPRRSLSSDALPVKIL